ncbi:MAG TPA: LCP family protein [Bacillota bacterium]|nr:LCP family protein [Bacillota bacterium]
MSEDVRGKKRGKKKGKPMSKRKKIIVILSSTLAVLLVAFFATAYLYVDAKLSLINRPEDSPTIPPGEEFFETDDPNGEGFDVMDPDDVVWPDDAGVIRDKNVINIMLIGQDRRSGEGRARSDSMMIATINKRTKTIGVTSLMRDLYVQIPGYSDNRINVSYAYGGMKLLNQTIERNFLIPIDGNIEVDFDGFEKVVDIIGGVEIPVNSREASHLRNQGFKYVTEGRVHMDGKLALAYSRIRKIGHADYERTERQRRVVTAAFNKTKGLPYNEIISMIDVTFPLVTTDLSNTQILSLAYTIYTMNAGEVETHRIPVSGAFREASIRGMSVLVPDLYKNRKALNEYIYGED